MNEKETQAAAILSLAVQSIFDVRFMGALLSEWRGSLAGHCTPEKARTGAAGPKRDPSNG
jgi:hypothetical protein